MTKTVALFEAAYKRLASRIDALNLDIEIYTFDHEGNFNLGAKKVPATEIEVDYLWLSPDLAGGVFSGLPFEMAMSCKTIDVLQTFNAGLDNPAYKIISDKGTRICKSSAQSIAIAEHILAHVLSLIHPIEQQRTYQKKKKWKRTPFRELSNTNWLIIGFGPIGIETANRVKSFGATIDVVRRQPKASEIVNRTGTMKDLERFLPEADVIVIACALNDNTRKFAAEKFFQRVKNNAILVNISRGPLIDDSAMISTLDRGQLAVAILDVFDLEPLPVSHPVLIHPKVRVTAHTSFQSFETKSRWDELFIKNLPRYVAGNTLLHEVNASNIV